MELGLPPHLRVLAQLVAHGEHRIRLLQINNLLNGIAAAAHRLLHQRSADAAAEQAQGRGCRLHQRAPVRRRQGRIGQRHRRQRRGWIRPPRLAAGR